VLKNKKVIPEAMIILIEEPTIKINSINNPESPAVSIEIFTALFSFSVYENTAAVIVEKNISDNIRIAVT